MGCAGPPSKGVGVPHQCSRVNEQRSGWGESSLTRGDAVRIKHVIWVSQLSRLFYGGGCVSHCGCCGCGGCNRARKRVGRLFLLGFCQSCRTKPPLSGTSFGMCAGQHERGGLLPAPRGPLMVLLWTPIRVLESRLDTGGVVLR